MKKHFLLLFALAMSVSFAIGQLTPVTKANYELPARFSPKKIDKMVFSTSVDAHWLKKSTRFWYS